MAIGLQGQGDALAFLYGQKAWEVTPGFELAGLAFWRRQLSQALLAPLNTEAGALVDLAHSAGMAAILLGEGLAWGRGRRWPTPSFALIGRSNHLWAAAWPLIRCWQRRWPLLDTHRQPHLGPGAPARAAIN